MKQSLPLILAGPIIRKVSASQISIWLTTSERLEGYTTFNCGQDKYDFEINDNQGIQLGKHAWVYLLQCEQTFPLNSVIYYDISTQHGTLSRLLPELLYPGNDQFSLIIKDQADYILHGSCRNPHYPSKDSLVVANQKLKKSEIIDRPSMLMMSGDQIYADDVAGPMLVAIQQIIKQLGLFEEHLPDDKLSHCSALYNDAYNLYHRDKILPHYTDTTNFLSRVNLYRSRPIFSASEHQNHLITFAEFFVMYLLVWSPTLWECVTLPETVPDLNSKWQQRWQKEKPIIEQFVEGLVEVQQLFAHLPTYMIFDDHDITDDWNLTIGWENAVNGHPLASQVIGNGLMSYFLCQGWGNNPEQFDDEFIGHFRELYSGYQHQ